MKISLATIILFFIGTSFIKDYGAKYNYKTVCAIVANKYEGNISQEELLNNSSLQLKPNVGRIIGYEVNMQSYSRVSRAKVNGSDFNSSTINVLKKEKVKSINFSNIFALIENDTILLNPIILKVGTSSNSEIISDFCVSLLMDKPFEIECKKSSPQNINLLRGFYNGKFLRPIKGTITYFDNGKPVVKNVDFKSDYFMEVVAIAKVYSWINITNLIFEKDNRRINGTPIQLTVVE